MNQLRRHLGQLLTATLLTFALLTTVGSARADIFGYIDADGMGHFSTEKLDNRYQLFMRGDGFFDSSQLAAGGAKPLDQKLRDSPLFRYLSQHPNLKKYEALVDQAAQEFALEPALLKAVMAAESGFNPAAVSPKGAIGLMQIMPATAERYGLTGDSKKPVEKKLTDPRTNIRLGARYLRDLLKLYPAQQELVIASYNAGEGAVQKYNNKVPPYAETRNYVQLVRQFYQLYQPAFAQSAASTNAGGKPGLNRIRLVIPGRSNMPAAIAPNLNPAPAPIPPAAAISATATPLIE
ncbi:transglycosylase SLT domain protein [Collimonas fungivorans]|uniref:Transglycosylase SLT domain protein n=1 Tax=Collimonas fungivorans TaxID=158899 RepID=A0A127PDQ1_9BURK|nr:lytic transglycosylase domain-containing protein [Collimonas fungivorans]AMO95877.1 transglycosylase SLT domain protein [Collimonas fungivorans]